MKMTATERRRLDEAQDVGVVLNAVAAMRAGRGGALPEDWGQDQYRAALSRCRTGRRVALFDFHSRYLWRVQVYDECRLIDGEERLPTQDGVSAWLAAHYPGTEAHQVDSFEEVLRILQASMTAKTSVRTQSEHAAVRLDTETLERLDALRPCFSTFWHEATESDVLRAVIVAGLDIVEGEARSTGKRPTPSDAERGGRGAPR